MIHQVQLFDKVRAYDFEEKDSCFVEGKVVGFARIEDCQRYAILVERRVFANRDVEVKPGEVVYPPVNGTPTTFGGVKNNVQVIK